MAKSTTTRGKTKTTKSKAVSAAKATSAKRTKKPVPKKGKTGWSLSAQLRAMHFAGIALYALLAVSAFVFIGPATYQVTVGHLSHDPLAVQYETVFAPAATAVLDVDLRGMIAIIMVLSAILPALYLTKLKKRYQAALKGRFLPWRWAGIAATFSLMTLVVSLLSGANELFTLKLIAGATVLSGVLGWLAEKQNNKGAELEKNSFIMAVFAGLLPWLLIAGYAVSTVIYGMVSAPWYVYALYVIVLGGTVALLINQWKQYRRVGRWSDYIYAERNYVLISLLTTVLFAAVLIAGLQQ